MNKLEQFTEVPFENIKHIDEEGNEFWYARELQKVLEYTQWRNFEKVIEKAKEACQNSGISTLDCFADVSKPIISGKGKQEFINDCKLSRYACYLIAQNGDPRKEVIAQAQTYFAVQTRRQELQDEFNNKGYQGLYGGLGQKDIHERKGLKKSQRILDHMGSEELAANLFRATQTDAKLRRENIQGKEAANETHFTVGEKVRQTIKDLGGTMPEDLPTPDKSFQTLRREKQKRLETSD